MSVGQNNNKKNREVNMARTTRKRRRKQSEKRKRKREGEERASGEKVRAQKKMMACKEW